MKLTFRIDDTLNPFLDKFWKLALDKYPLKENEKIIPDNQLEDPRIKVILEDQGDSKEEFNSFIKEIKKLTPDDHWQDVRHISFDITDSKIKYESGDVLGIKPENSKELSLKMIERLGLNPDKYLSIPHYNLSKINILDLFQKYLDFQSTPKKRFFEIVHHFAKDEIQKEKLESFSKESEELYRYSIKEKRTYLEVLNEFPSINVPFEYIFDLIPLIQPRYFSISSSQLITPNEIHITVAIVEYRTPYKRVKRGLCTNWFSQMKGKEKVKIFIKKGSIKLPENHKIPIVMIGPGTGMAPFKAFSLERLYYSNSDRIGRTVLFFGNRNEKKDYFYSEEFKELELKYPFQIITAFSRDQEKKVYVQDKIYENGSIIVETLENNGYIYVAGNSKQMPRDVREIILKVIVERTKLTQEEASKYLLKMELEKRYQCETWS